MLCTGSLELAFDPRKVIAFAETKALQLQQK
ncbi:hypothetical protein swp_0989 [Shewanella piezotolerans WP3]|uniref:Uncharacterized protein n=1 Tax=Shewanella piezotolerans (strain WP3 / JCM 13877) TaxID=225849 RepID=B8CJ30_SHEPW|nr:hypothetical protein swp_0989 [Shewanella piezotolerans WP3]